MVIWSGVWNIKFLLWGKLEMERTKYERRFFPFSGHIYMTDIFYWAWKYEVSRGVQHTQKFVYLVTDLESDVIMVRIAISFSGRVYL